MAAAAARSSPGPGSMSTEARGTACDFDLYEAESMFYLVEKDQCNKTCRVLKIDRSEPTKLTVVEDSTSYTMDECVCLLQQINDNNKATGGLKHVAKCYGIVGFVKFLGPYYMILITGRSKIGTISPGHDVYSVDESKAILIPAPNVLPSVANSKDEKRYLTRFCSLDLSKDFFFCYSYNLGQTLQNNINGKNALGFQNDTTFVWNEFLTNCFREQIKSPIWSVALVHGFFRQEKVSGSVKDFVLTIIARRSRNVAGPRLLNRGVNVEGMVANDVEVEQIVFEETQDGNAPQMTSVVQRRGSIPLFWSQDTTRCPIKPDILLKPGDNYNMARLHFENLKTRYGEPVVVLSLIKSFEKKPHESLLRSEFEKAIEHINEGLSTDNQIPFVHIDMKKYSRSHEVLPLLVSIGSEALRKTGIFHCQITPAPKSMDNTSVQSDITSSTGSDNVVDPYSIGIKMVPVSLQNGVLRTNCLDCLDRTNSAQFAYGLSSLGHQVFALGLTEAREIAVNDTLSHILMNLYEQMGDALSMQYAGSAALNKVFWKHRGQCGVISLVQGIFRSVQRFVSSICVDRAKQKTLDLFLGYFQPQQGILSVPNICGNEETPNDREHERTMQERHLVDEGPNHLSESKKPELFYSNFLKLSELQLEGPLTNDSHGGTANGHSTDFQ
ncbi:unnamed protein product [Urochloa humidicola]